MPSPQLKNGYTRVANEILEQLASLRLSTYEWQFLIALFRLTYGWHKKEDWISASQFSALTQISKWHLSRTKRKLIQKGLVTQMGNKLKFNKDWSEWKRGYPNRQRVTQIGKAVTQIGNKRLPKQVDTKDIKDINTKDTSSTRKSRCPLEKPSKGENSNLSLIRKNYPNGHKECVEFIKSCGSFPNFAKQIGALHQILRAGFDFEAMNEAIGEMEKDKFYRDRAGWDFSTLSNYIGRRWK